MEIGTCCYEIMEVYRMDMQYDFLIGNICGMGISFRLDGFRVLYVLIASFMWLMAMLFSKEYMAHYENKKRYYIFSLLTYLATVGVFLSADLFTAFLFFEIMSFTSYVWVAQDEKKESLRAADTYLAIAVMGGLVLLMGLFLLYNMTGTLRMDELLSASTPFLGTTKLYLAGGCILFGFGAKAGAFPLHVWLPKAHPVAPAPASALLSGILTKAGIFGILIISCEIFLGDIKWATLILTIGTITMFLGALLALFSINLKRTLACSSVSQIGFILVGVGMQGFLGNENYLAVRGTLLHMVNHSMIKLALFMAAGVVFMNIHELDLNKIKGFGRKKPLLTFIFLMGSLGIAGVPGFNGYISKTLLHEGIVEYIDLLQGGEARVFLYWIGSMKAIEWIFLISGGITVAYMTKIFIAVFVEKNEDEALQQKFDENKKYMNPLSAFALTLSAVFMPIAGLLPHQVSDKIADMGQHFMNVTVKDEIVAYFSLTNLKGALISIVIGVILYFVVVRLWMIRKGVYVNRWPKYLDLEDYFYRPLLLVILPIFCTTVCRVFDRLLDTIVVVLRKTIFKDSKLPEEPEEGNGITHTLGEAADGFVHKMNQTVWRYQPHTENKEHKLALKYQELSENNTIIGRSLSFGLLLVCVGLILVLVYLLL